MKKIIGLILMWLVLSVLTGSLVVGFGLLILVVIAAFLAGLIAWLLTSK